MTIFGYVFGPLKRRIGKVRRWLSPKRRHIQTDRFSRAGHVSVSVKSSHGFTSNFRASHHLYHPEAGGAGLGCGSDEIVVVNIDTHQPQAVLVADDDHSNGPHKCPPVALSPSSASPSSTSSVVPPSNPSADVTSDLTVSVTLKRPRVGQDLDDHDDLELKGAFKRARIEIIDTPFGPSHSSSSDLTSSDLRGNLTLAVNLKRPRVGPESEGANKRARMIVETASGPLSTKLCLYNVNDLKAELALAEQSNVTPSELSSELQPMDESP